MVELIAEKSEKFKTFGCYSWTCKVGAPLDASTAVDFTENYLFAFEEELKKAKDPDTFITTMKERFPSADLLLALERGAKANVKP